MKNRHQLQAWQAAALLARREISAVDLTRACLAQIELREAEVHAFAHLDADAALAQARALDAGPLRGLLHGLPLGVKDLIDTTGMPTSYGSALYAGHQPVADAAVVALCREAGALLPGKTVSTEFAYFQPGPTVNPHSQAGSPHTPGGSSSGSAAAVAACMLPLALGTQTAGSIIRPAAYCGVVGYKPSLGLVPRAGVKSLSEALDVIGGFGRSVRDVSLLGAVLSGDMRMPEAMPADFRPNIGLCRGPEWQLADADMGQAWELAVKRLAPHASLADLELPPALHGLVALQKSVMAFEMARALSHERVQHRDRLSARLLALLDEGMTIGGDQHLRDLVATAAAQRVADALFDRFDVILAPSATGEAPAGISATGDPVFCRGWTLLGLPCVHLPFTEGRLGLPIGLQLVGRWGQDKSLLALAHQLHERLKDE